MDRLKRNRRAVLDRLARACEGAGRERSEVCLVAVTKTVEPEIAHELFRLGELDLGENRAAELERKVAWFEARDARARWHFIGHVQRNKARRVARLADQIHSVDSSALVESLGRIAAEEDVRPGLFLQVKLTSEDTKYGLDAAELPRVVERASGLGLALRGLMTMAALEPRDGGPTAVFERLAQLADDLPRGAFEDGRIRLSMGMSGDLEAAVASGAHLVRVGSALFEGLDAEPSNLGEAG